MKKQILIAAMALTTLAACQSDVNPLLVDWNTPYQTPPFNEIKVEHYAPAFDVAIAEARAEIDAIVADTAAPTFANTIEALERAGSKLTRIEYIFFNILEADANEQMQQVSMEVQPKLTEYSNDVSLNPELFARVKAVYDQRESLDLSLEEAKLLEKTYKSFSRNGAALDEEKKAQYREISAELSQLTLQFGQNVLAATNAFTYNITDSTVVAELPDFVKEGLAADAKARGEQGWTVTLQAPSYGPFMTYSSNRELKEQLWRAYNSRAMVDGANDNREIVKRIAELRLQMANLLSYATYADYVLEERMAESADNVNNFLKELLDATKKYAEKDYATINAYAKSLGLQGEVMPWDFSYYSEKYKNEKYALSDEMVKPYLKLDNVKKGVFMLATKLYGLEFKENTEIAPYHPEVSVYEVYDATGKMMAILYLDFFPRETKRGGAWMTEFRAASFDEEGNEIRPLVSLVMNFTKPTENTPSLLTFDEFTTFLHEFGHALHGMLGEGKY
ncbi:MAG: M3 family metallopeptidase, partial [Rikenellaceae bacterium]|nr:M3 family metallopeptidase [Rikenellaceae bacterium]